MKRSSKYFALRYLVECKPSYQTFYEPIAAYNDDGIAINYAVECSRAANAIKHNSDYRVMERKSRGYNQIHPKACN